MSVEGTIKDVRCSLQEDGAMVMRMVIECNHYSYIVHCDVPEKPDPKWALQQTEIICKEMVKNLEYVDPYAFVPELLKLAQKARKIGRLPEAQLH